MAHFLSSEFGAMPVICEVANNCSLTRERKDSSWEYRQSKRGNGERVMKLG